MINKLIVGPTRSTLNIIKTNLTHMRTCTYIVVAFLIVAPCEGGELKSYHCWL